MVELSGPMFNTTCMQVPREALTTAHLALVPVSPAHAESLFQAVVVSQPELVAWMPWAREPTFEGTLAQTVSSERDWDEDLEFHFSLIDRRNGRVLGIAGLNRDGAGSAELHYWIRTDHSGQGLTTEACKELIAWAPRALGVNRLTLWAGRDNAASRRVATKLGFQHIGPLDWRPEGGLGPFDAESYVLTLP
jgi:RimJ/RimL family protein N-acetyltransferase